MTSDQEAAQDERQIAFFIPADLHRRIRVLAAKEDKPMTAWMREALQLVADRVEGSS